MPTTDYAADLFQSAPEREALGNVVKGRSRGAAVLFQSAPEREALGNLDRLVERMGRQGFNPPQSARLWGIFLTASHLTTA